jgi:hypothetical protein
MKRIFLLPLIFLLLSACGTSTSSNGASAPATGTPDPLEIFVGANSSQRTAQAAQATADYFGQQITATVMARDALATERAFNLQSTQIAANITVTAQSAEATMTADSINATSTAAYTQTAVALQVAGTQMALTTTAEANEANAKAYAVAMDGEAQRVKNAIERDRMTNTLKAFMPLVMLAAAFGVFLVLAYHRGRIIIVQRDERGDAKLIGDVVDGIVSDPDRQANGMSGLRRRDLELLPPPSAERQAEVTERDQMVDLATRPGGDDGERRRQAARQMTEARPKAALPESVITIVEPEQVSAVVQDVMPPLLMDATEGEIKKDGE